MKTSIKKLLYVPFVLATLFFLAACGSDSDSDVNVTPFTPTTSFHVTLTGAQQVPFNNSMQNATATVEIDDTNNLMRASIDISGVTGFAAAHLHSGSIGVNGGVNFQFLPTDNSAQYSVPLSSASSSAIAEILNGDWYVNLHTADFPDGEIRGQIVPNSVLIVSFPLSGEQSVPAKLMLAMILRALI